MRDLASRLREIVRRDTGSDAGPLSSSPARELTYVPDADPAGPSQDVARLLGGHAIDPDGACIAIDRLWPSDRSHGRQRVGNCVLEADAPLHLFDSRVGMRDEWWRRVVFFDIETTGLSGGAGTLAFLAGCAWFDEDGLRVRQFLLASPVGERALLDALGRVFEEASLLVTFNGRTFDVPFMETRWAFHRRSVPTDDLPHFDMLPPSRRFWSRREPSSGFASQAAYDADGLPTSSCSLASLEHAVLGFTRHADVPGFEIPARYFHFLRTGDARAIDGVLDHNRHDLVSLAALTAHLLWLAREGALACREPSEQIALGRLYERAGDVDRAVLSYELAVRTGEREMRRQALSRLAVLLRREGRHDEAAGAWQTLLNLTPDRDPATSPLGRRAAEALAIHHEHRGKDPVTARSYARLLSAGTAAERAAAREDVAHRLRRLERKIEATKNTTSGPTAARLFQS